jgi:2-aminoadipate transaminase
MGLPDPQLFPVAAMADASRKLILNNRSALQYTLPCEPLKEKICAYMAGRGVDCSPDSVFLTHGAQQGVYLIAKLLLDLGSSIVEESISYPGFQHLIDAFLPVVLSVPTSPVDGIDICALERILKGGARPAFLYVMPTAHNPLGVTLPMVKRRRLADLAREFRVPLVEDDPYGSLFYGSISSAPIRTFDKNWVYYVGSFSKVLAPSLRIGWIVAPPEHIRSLSVIKEASDLNISTLSHWLVDAYLESNEFAAHLRMIRSVYRERRDAMNAALLEHFGSTATWIVPEAGVFFWVNLPDSVDASELLTTCLENERVAFLPAEACSRGKHKNGMRLNFSRCNPGQIADGIGRIGRILHRINSVDPQTMRNDFD